MNPIYVPLLSALAGAIIGSAASITTIVIQAKIGDRRQKIQQATTLAIEELKIQRMRRLAPLYIQLQFTYIISLQY